MAKLDPRAVTLDDGSRYLEVAWRVADARAKGYTVLTHAVKITPLIAVFRADVINGKTSEVAAQAFGSRAKKHEPAYVEHAETAAVGRALSEAGFNLYSYELPDDVDAQAIKLDDGSDYLNVAWRIASFRKEHPEAVIKKELCGEFDGGEATVKVSVWEDGYEIATGHARREYSDTDTARNYIEYAETAATGRALSMLGYDLPPAKGNLFSDAADVADAPEKTITGGKTEKAASGTGAPGKTEAPKPGGYVMKGGTYKGRTLSVIRNTLNRRYFDALLNPASKISKGEPEASRAAMEFEKEHKKAVEFERAAMNLPGPADETATPVETYSNPEEFRMPVGQHKDEKLGDLWEEDRDYVIKLAFAPAAKRVRPEINDAALAMCDLHGFSADDHEKWLEKKRSAHRGYAQKKE